MQKTNWIRIILISLTALASLGLFLGASKSDAPFLLSTMPLMIYGALEIALLSIEPAPQYERRIRLVKYGDDRELEEKDLRQAA